MKLPKSIEPCPIIESIIELRFLASEPDDAIFGLVHKEIKEEYKSVQKLPILNLPEQIRNNQPNFKFKPYYKFSNKDYDINLGPRVISIIKREPYNGWKRFSSEAKSIFYRLSQLEIVSEILRLGLRYTNFFDENIYDKVDLELTLGDENFIKKDTYIKNTYEKSGHNIILQLGNSSTLRKGNEVRSGSVLDVDVSIENLSTNFLVNSEEVLNKVHKVEKETFFGLLKNDFINELNPQY